MRWRPCLLPLLMAASPRALKAPRVGAPLRSSVLLIISLAMHASGGRSLPSFVFCDSLQIRREKKKIIKTAPPHKLSAFRQRLSAIRLFFSSPAAGTQTNGRVWPVTYVKPLAPLFTANRPRSPARDSEGQSSPAFMRLRFSARLPSAGSV